MDLIQELKNVIKKYEQPDHTTYVGYCDMTKELFQGVKYPCNIDLVMMPYKWRSAMMKHGAHYTISNDPFSPLLSVGTPYGTIETVGFWAGSHIQVYKKEGK